MFLQRCNFSFFFVPPLKILCRNEETEIILWPHLSIWHLWILAFSPPHVWQAKGGDLQSRAEISAMENSWIPSWLILKWELELSNNFKLSANFHTKQFNILKDFHHIVFVKRKTKASETMAQYLRLVVLADNQYGLKYQNRHRLFYPSEDILLYITKDSDLFQNS